MTPLTAFAALCLFALIVFKAQTERVKNGVCPCCNRSFQNLRRHMETKHPDFEKASP